MAVTENTFTQASGDGTNRSFTFEYLKQSDVKVTVAGVAKTNPADWTFHNATTVKFNTAPANGSFIRIYRETADATLAATFYAGSAIKSQDLNDNFTQNLYVTQEVRDESALALTNSREHDGDGTYTTAIAKSTSAVATAGTASTNASAAVATANTASTNASNAVSTANTASTNATNAVNTANAATTTANTASTNATNAVNTANAATTTANTASTNATNAVSTANTASTNATNAVSTANTASTNASNAVTTANSASSTATAAQTAVAAAVLYTPYANVAAIPGSPSDGDYVEVQDSTGIESFSPLASMPSGFTGDDELTIKLLYNGAGKSPANTWVWQQYYATDPEVRYRKKIIVENKTTIDENYTIGTNNNAFSVGPVTVAANKTVTIPENSLFLIH